MATELIRYAAGADPNVSPTERYRLRVALLKLEAADNPADLLRSWLASRADRRE